MKEWWNGLQPREQRTLLVGGIALGIIFFIFVIWMPAHRNVNQLEEQLAEERELLEWMREASAEIRAAGGAEAQRPPPTDGRSLFALADRTARQAGLNNIRVDTSGEGQIRVNLDGAPFDNIVRWLADLRRNHGVTATLASVREADQPGRVDAQLVLEVGG